MDKVKRVNCFNDYTSGIQISNILDTLDEIIDWIDESEQPLRELVEEINRIKAWLTTHDERDAAAAEQMEEFGFHRAQSIEQELEAGLAKHKLDESCRLHPRRLTRIYLPEAKWKQLKYGKALRHIDGKDRFHGIPVYCGGPDIHYCTD